MVESGGLTTLGSDLFVVMHPKHTLSVCMLSVARGLGVHVLHRRDILGLDRCGASCTSMKMTIASNKRLRSACSVGLKIKTAHPIPSMDPAAAGSPQEHIWGEGEGEG